MAERGPVAAAILAGGQARRMGGANKALLRIGGQRILDRQVALLRQVASEVFVVSHRQEEFAGLGIEVVPDAIAGVGPLGGIYTALQRAAAPRVLVLGCDLPFVTLPLLQRLTQPSDADVVVPRSGRGYEPLCATWAGRTVHALAERLDAGEFGVSAALEGLQLEVLGADTLAASDPHGLLFVNVNTPHDHERARRLSRRGSKSSRDRIMDVLPDP